MSVAEMIEIPTEFLADGARLPDVCARHGSSAAQRADFVIKSRPDLGSPGRLAIPGYTVLNRADDYAKKVKFIEVSGWPLCARCVRRRAGGRLAAGILFFGGIAAMVISAVAGLTFADGNRLLSIPFMAGFVEAALLAPWIFAWSGLALTTRTQATPDGTAVRVDEPDPEFRRQLDRRLS
ncbi:hypothetical protein Q0Z83_063180 [Actinoplanes sichuanensis]|uniref:Uncharacterized protein n=1 Tax=Actinoplanes sichuanensis TaxID=512349 RepID=A0ABW4A001_9ACTN|nr:hypothetical protein [Actinoplanes sichuanensis]BEL08127.1 hypothetical protein Q0Z83_063180 [Actinoplanes sichuanensis]